MLKPVTETFKSENSKKLFPPSRIIKRSQEGTLIGQIGLSSLAPCKKQDINWYMPCSNGCHIHLKCYSGQRLMEELQSGSGLGLNDALHTTMQKVNTSDRTNS